MLGGKRSSYAVGASSLLAVFALGQFVGAGPVPSSFRSPVQRPAQPPAEPAAGSSLGAPVPAQFPAEFRPINGWGNNPLHPEWGSSGINLVRSAAPDYGKAGSPAGDGRRSAREISNLCAAQHSTLVNGMGASDFAWQWGQFLDHDIDETPVTSPGEAFDIQVPTGDMYFDPMGDGDKTIPLDRSAFTMVKGVREQLNNITSYIDASNVYGADDVRATALRAMDGTGRLRMSAGDLLPYNTGQLPNAPTSMNPTLFLAGDVRANEQVGLTAMHTLFVREHNWWAARVHMRNRQLDGDGIYEHARAMVTAEMQAITYREFLPVMLGPDAIAPFAGYNPEANPGITNEFATAAYRVGHTMLSPTLRRVDANGDMIAEGHIALRDAFFNPAETEAVGIEPVLRGLCGQLAQNVDPHVIDDVRNFLFGPPGAGGFDLAALNIQRGRDHGLASYNDLRVAYGMPAAKTFADISPDMATQIALAAAYDDVDDIDAWIGLLSEPHVPGAMVGETLVRVVGRQFENLRDGDRFWYESYLPPAKLAFIQQQTLAGIIRRNTTIGDELADNVFVIDAVCIGDLDGDGIVGLTDVLQILSNWGPCGGCMGDFDKNGSVGFLDLLEVISRWGDCP